MPLVENKSPACLFNSFINSFIKYLLNFCWQTGKAWGFGDKQSTASIRKELRVQGKRKTRTQNECVASRDRGGSRTALWTLPCFRYFSPVTFYSHVSPLPKQACLISTSKSENVEDHKPRVSDLGRGSYI